MPNCRCKKQASKIFLLGTGFVWDWTKNISAKLAYTGDLRSDFYANTFSGSLSLKF